MPRKMNLKKPRRLRLKLTSNLLNKSLQNKKLQRKRPQSQRLRPQRNRLRLQNQLQSQRPRRRSQSNQRELWTLLILLSQIPFSKLERKKLPMTTRLETRVLSS